jgi:hypothetical protein
MAPDPSGWPWPLDAVQNWFESLWNYISDTVYTALNNIWTTAIQPAINWLNNQVFSAANWLWGRVQNIQSAILDTLSAWGLLITNSFNNAIGWIQNSINDGLNWLNANVTSAFNWIKSSITDGLTWLYNQIVNAVNYTRSAIEDAIKGVKADISKDLSTEAEIIKDRISDNAAKQNLTIEQVNTSLNTRFDSLEDITETNISSLWDSLVGLAGDILSGVAKSLGDSLKGFFDWLVKSLSYIAEMVVGAINIVIDRIRSALSWLYNLFANTITGAMSTSSPPKEISQAITVMNDTIAKRQIEIINSAYHSEPTSESIFSASNIMMATLLTAGSAGMMLATAADLAHPFKDTGFKITMRELIYWAGIPSVTAALAILPTSIGLLTPARYFYNEQWPNVQPEAGDLIRFGVREVFIPEELERLTKPPPPRDFYTYMKRLGFKEFWADAYWAAHWVRPSISELNQALYRDIIKSEEWIKEVRLNDLAPYSIPWLQKIIYSPYTRVDIRRMWDMRVVTEEEVKTNYKWLGYDEEHATRMTLWTKIYTMEAELRSRYSKGWITEKQVRDELLAAGMPKERINEWVEKIIKADKPERTAAEKDLTKAEIIKGAKVKVITPEQAVSLLMDLGYEDWEAWYILAINAIVSVGDPEGYWDMKRVTELYKKSQKLPYREVPQELIDVEKAIKNKKVEIEKLKADKQPEAIISQPLADLANLEYRYRQLMITWEKSSSPLASKQ